MRIHARVVFLVTGILFFGIAAVQARWMNTGTGRFYSMDTFEGNKGEPLSIHRYIYCKDNPLNGIDPSGRITVKSGEKKDDLTADRGDTHIDWTFTLDKAPPQDGFIVQEIPLEQDKKDGVFKKHYWEAWFVPASTDGSRPQVYDHWDLPSSDALKGIGHVHSKIKYFFESRTGFLGNYQDPNSKPDPKTGWHPGDGKTWSKDLPWKEEPAPTWWTAPSDNGESDAWINLDITWEYKQITSAIVSAIANTIDVTPDSVFP